MRASELVILRVTNSRPRRSLSWLKRMPLDACRSVRLAVVHRHVVAEHLGDAVRRARVERRPLGLRRLAHLAEHLRRARLVEADRVVLGAADDAHRLEHAQHAEAGDLRGELGLLERELHEADRAEVVDLVGLHLLDRGDQRREVAQVAADELETGALLLHELGLRVRLSGDEAEHLVPLRGQELTQVPTVLPGDTGDERALHAFLSAWRSRPPRRAWDPVEITPAGWNCPIPRGGDRAGRGIRHSGPLRRVSPIAPAVRRRPSSAARKPRFSGCADRT